MTVLKHTAIITLLAVGISGCSPKSGGSSPSAPATASEVTRDFSSTAFAVSSDIPSDYANCSFNGQTVLHNATVNAFQNSSVAYGSTCVSQVRRCNDGVLSGAYQFSSCTIAGPASCLFNGQTIAHGTNVEAFQNSTVNFGSSCSSEQRTCNNGVLSGSNAFATCNVAGPASCLFNGQTIAHDTSVSAFANSTVAFGQTCSAEQRTCNNGVLSGSNAYASCNVESAASCLFNGQTVAHGSNVSAFANSTVAFGETCTAEQRTCNNGVLSGSSAYASCNVDAAASCLFNGLTVAHGSNVPAFTNSSVAYGQTCEAESRTCNNGVLSGSGAYASCSVEAAASCLFNGQTVAHGQGVQAFQNSTQAFGTQCVSEQRSCDNGIMTGSYQYGSCNVDAAASCLFNGQTVAHGQSVQAFPSSSVSFGEMCISDSRTCNNGILSGSNQFATCSTSQPASCLFNGQTIAHNQSIQAFAISNVAFGQSCVAEERSCFNGVLDGSSEYASCTVAQAESCLINGLTVAHGQSTILFKDSSVANGQSCESEARTCNNGALTGSYTAGSCVVEEAPVVVTPPASAPVVVNPPVVVTPPVSSPIVVVPPVVVTPPIVVTPPVSSPIVVPPIVVPPTGPKSCKILFGLITIPHGFTIWAAANTTAGSGSRCEAEITLCNDGKFVIDPSLTCQQGNKPPVTVPPPKPGEVQCELDVKSNNGKHIGVNHDGKHADSGLHLGWYKDKKPCKESTPVKPPVAPTPPKPIEEPCEEDFKSNNGKHLGINHAGKHPDNGLHLGWYKDKKTCKEKKPVHPPKPDPKKHKK